MRKNTIRAEMSRMQTHVLPTTEPETDPNW